MNNLAKHIKRIEHLACLYTHDQASRAQAVAEMGVAVASLNGRLPDDGKALAFGAAALLAAEYIGIRAWCLEVLQGDIRAALREVGSRR